MDKEVRRMHCAMTISLLGVTFGDEQGEMFAARELPRSERSGVAMADHRADNPRMSSWSSQA